MLSLYVGSLYIIRGSVINDFVKNYANVNSTVSSKLLGTTFSHVLCISTSQLVLYTPITGQNHVFGLFLDLDVKLYFI